MSIKPFLIFMFCASFNTYSQDSIPKYSTIELNNGEKLHGEIAPFFDKAEIIKICKNNNCEKYPTTKINKISLLPDKYAIKIYKKIHKQELKKNPNAIYDESRMIINYKVLYYNPDSKKNPALGNLIHDGEKFQFYKYKGSSDYESKYRILIVKNGSSKIEKSYTEMDNNEKNLKNLLDYFKECDELKNEAKQKNKKNKWSISYKYRLYELADKCSY